MTYKKNSFYYYRTELFDRLCNHQPQLLRKGKQSGKNEGEGSLNFRAASAVDYKITDELGSPLMIDIKKKKKSIDFLVLNLIFMEDTKSSTLLISD